ncbi:MAG TPA: FHA domain-containing protein, partial [Myxococcota bacterium]
MTSTTTMNKTERITASSHRDPGDGGASAALILYHQTGTDVVTLGRGESVVLGRDRLPEPNVSRRHCEVTFDGERVFVRDLSSTNGTKVGGRDVGLERVDAGHEIQLGTAVVAVHILPHGAPRPESLPGHTWLLGELRAQM